ncbi:hypothetical protein [Microbacterium sp. KNMS]
MAKITVENAVVDRTFTTQFGHGVAVHETFERKDGAEGKSYFTLWFKDDPGVVQGQVISASGFHGVKVREYEHNGETRHTADVSVRAARLIGSAPPIPPAPEQASQDQWGAPASGGGWDAQPF